MKRTPPPVLQARLIALLEKKNFAALEQLTGALRSLEQALLRITAHRAGLLSRAEVCTILGVTPEALSQRITRGRLPRPVQGAGREAIWRLEDIRQGPRLRKSRNRERQEV